MIKKIICGFLAFLGFQGCHFQDKQNHTKTVNTIVLPYFGEIIMAPAKDYEVVIKLNNYSFSSDLNFYEDVVERSSLEVVDTLLKDLSSFIIRSEEILITDYKKGGTVNDYIEHHLDVFEVSELNNLLKNDNSSEPIAIKLLSKLKLVRLGFYPDDKDHFAVFDFSIGNDLTDYRITIRYNSSGKFDSLEFVS